jgi:hypothetical protein
MDAKQEDHQADDRTRSGALTGRKRTQFAKGQSGNPSGRPPGIKGATQGSNPTQILRDLRWAYNHSADQVKGTPQQEDLRKLYQKDCPKFLALLTKHEGMNKPAVAAVAHSPKGRNKEVDAEPEEPIDEGTEKALHLCDKLLKEFAEERRKEDAELAKRPDAAQYAATLQHTLTAALEREAMLLKRLEEAERKLT